MMCDRCGREYPSQNYFNFNAVPGMQICTACVEALSSRDLEALRESSRLPKKPAGIEPGQFVFPRVCCSCMGLAETKMLAASSYNDGSMIKTFSIQVPVCRSCSRRYKIPEYVGPAGIGLGALIGLLAGGIPGGILGGFLGYIIGYTAGSQLPFLRAKSDPGVGTWTHRAW